MPVLFNHIVLPLDLWSCVETLHNTMMGALFYLTAFLASSSLVPNGAVQSVSAQYLLGLGKWCLTVRCPVLIHDDCNRHWRYHRVNFLQFNMVNIQER